MLITKHIKRYVISFLKDISRSSRNSSSAGLETGSSGALPIDSPDGFVVDLVTSDASSVSPFGHIEQSLLPLQCYITHFPMYALDLLPPSESFQPPRLRVFGMVSSIYRSLGPLVYTQMSFDHLEAVGLSAPLR